MIKLPAKLRSRKMALYLVPRRILRHLRLFFETTLAGLRATGGEVATSGLAAVVQGGGAGLFRPAGRNARELYAGGRGKQYPRVWMPAVPPQAGGRRLLHQMPGVHNADAVAEIAGNL